jgi:hypothetical protein
MSIDQDHVVLREHLGAGRVAFAATLDDGEPVLFLVPPTGALAPVIQFAVLGDVIGSREFEIERDPVGRISCIIIREIDR